MVQEKGHLQLTIARLSITHLRLRLGLLIDNAITAAVLSIVFAISKVFISLSCPNFTIIVHQSARLAENTSDYIICDIAVNSIKAADLRPLHSCHNTWFGYGQLPSHCRDLEDLPLPRWKQQTKQKHEAA